MKRKQPTLKQKLAAALLYQMRPDENGVLHRIIPHEKAKGMTAEQIIREFEFHHSTFAFLGGPNEPWNLVPLTKAEHRWRTKRDVKEIAKVRRGLKKRAGQKRKSRPMPGTKASGIRKRMSGKVEAWA